MNDVVYTIILNMICQIIISTYNYWLNHKE